MEMVLNEQQNENNYFNKENDRQIEQQNNFDQEIESNPQKPIESQQIVSNPQDREFCNQLNNEKEKQIRND